MKRFEDNIYFDFKGKPYYIRTNSIAWYVVRTAQIFIVFLAMTLPYLTAIIVAGCLGF